MAKVKNYNILSHYTYSLPGWSGMLGLLFWLIVGSLLGGVVMIIFRAFMSTEAATTYGMLVSYPLQFIPAMMYASSNSRRKCINSEGVKLDNNHFGVKGGAVCALMVAAATLCSSYCCDALTNLLPQMPDALAEVMKSMTQGPLWANLLCVAVFAPLFEEWLCRGMVLRGLLNHNVKPVWAIVASAVFFAVIHGNPWQAIPAFLLGCLFGYIYFKTGSLKLTMLMHCVNNAFSVIMSHLDAFKDAESWLDIIEPRAYWIIFAACLMMLILIVKFFVAIPLENKEGNMDKVPSLFEQ